jgi:hypothetical protein
VNLDKKDQLKSNNEAQIPADHWLGRVSVSVIRLDEN